MGRSMFRIFYKKVAKDKKKYKNGRPLLFCIIQGSVYKNLRISFCETIIGHRLSAKADQPRAGTDTPLADGGR